MKRIATSVFAFVAILASLPAAAWDIDAMNEQISQTNFIVDGGCSGTLISLEKRLILTNYHCIQRRLRVEKRERVQPDGTVKEVKVERRDPVPVEQHAYDGFTKVGSSAYVAEIVAHEQGRDLAILKLRQDPIPQKMASPLLPKESSVKRGERVYVVGNPALNDATVVEGIVSNVNRTFQFPWTKNEYLPMIQFSGGIYGGNSGGALYNNKGELIGVPAAGHRSANFIGLAIPIDIVRLVLDDFCLASVYDPEADDEKCETDKAKEGDDD